MAVFEDRVPRALPAVVSVGLHAAAAALIVAYAAHPAKLPTPPGLAITVDMLSTAVAPGTEVGPAAVPAAPAPPLPAPDMAPSKADETAQAALPADLAAASADEAATRSDAAAAPAQPAPEATPDAPAAHALPAPADPPAPAAVPAGVPSAPTTLAEYAAASAANDPSSTPAEAAGTMSAALPSGAEAAAPQTPSEQPSPAAAAPADQPGQPAATQAPAVAEVVGAPAEANATISSPGTPVDAVQAALSGAESAVPPAITDGASPVAAASVVQPETPTAPQITAPVDTAPVSPIVASAAPPVPEASAAGPIAGPVAPTPVIGEQKLASDLTVIGPTPPVPAAPPATAPGVIAAQPSPTQLAELGGPADTAASALPAVPNAPSATLAEEPDAPAPSPPAQVATLETGPSVAAIEAFVAGYDGGSCFYAAVARASANGAAIDVLSDQKPKFQALNDAFVAKFGLDPNVLGQRVTAAQCPAVDLLRRSGSGNLRLQVDRNRLSIGDMLTGTVETEPNNLASLDLVDETGRVQDVTQFVRPEGGRIAFVIPIAHAARGGSYPQLLIAVSDANRPLAGRLALDGSFDPSRVAMASKLVLVGDRLDH